MAMQQAPGHRLPNIRFRVLIIGRANSGKTSILQRVCDTTQSPIIRRRSSSAGQEESVCGLTFMKACQCAHHPTRFNSRSPWRFVMWYHLPPVADPRASVAITTLRTNSPSLTIRVTRSMIPADLSQVATRNWRMCRILFDESRRQSDWHLEYMQYGVYFEIFMIATADGNVWGTAYRWTTNGLYWIWSISKIFAPIWMVCDHYDGSAVVLVNISFCWSPCHWGIHKVWSVQDKCWNGFGGPSKGKLRRWCNWSSWQTI